MSIEVFVKWREGSCLKTYDQPVTAEQVYAEIEEKLPYRILICHVDNVPHRLDVSLTESCTLELLDIRNHEANMSYQASLTLLYIRAVHEVLGEQVKVRIGNSLDKGLYTTIVKKRISDKMLKKIYDRMEELVEKDLPILHRQLTPKEILDYLPDYAVEHMEKIFRATPDVEVFDIYSLGNEHLFFYANLVPRTGYLHHFELRRYKRGILLRFAGPQTPEEIPESHVDELMYQAFAQETKWNHLLQIHYAKDLNAKILDGDYKDLILLSEALQEKRIAEIASEIVRKKKRVILIAGPSSSGKTTFSKRLIIQLRVNGLNPLYLGTDDYFVERDDTPIGPDGKPNYEDLEAIDLPLFESQMNDLLQGKDVDLPEFDFLDGKKYFGRRITCLKNNEPIVIEGIHALNPKMTEDIPEEEKYRIYISPLTELNIDGYNRIPTTEARILRRIVRDHQFRGSSAARTIGMWPSVRAGEDKNIFPYSREADVLFNSHLIYELAILKKYAAPLLEAITPDMEEYGMAQRLLHFLQFFAAMDNDSLIPSNSIMREFIGGSIIAD